MVSFSILASMILTEYVHSSATVYPGKDPCTALCSHDGPSVCTGGSFVKNGICHAYYFLGDPNTYNYCYHSAATRAVCPSSGTPVRPEHAALIIARLATTLSPGHNARTTTLAPTTTRNAQDFALFMIRAQLGINYVPPPSQQGSTTTTAPRRDGPYIDPAWIMRDQVGIDSRQRDRLPARTTAAPSAKREATTRRSRTMVTGAAPLPGISDSTPLPISEDEDLNLDLVPQKEALGDLARAIIFSYFDPRGEVIEQRLLERGVSRVFGTTDLFDESNTEPMALFKEVRGHVLIQTAMREDLLEDEVEYIRIALILSLNFEHLIPFLELDRERFAIESGLSFLCETHIEEIKAVIKNDFNDQWRRRISYPTSEMEGMVYQTSYAANLPLYCPNIIGDDIELRSIVLQQRLYRNGIYPSGQYARGLTIIVPRATPFKSAISHLTSASTTSLRLSIDAVRIEGEGGRGEGIIREWFSIATAEIFNPESGFFKVDKMGRYHIVPSPVNSTVLDAFKAVGIFLGMSLIQGRSLGVMLPASYCAQMLGLDLDLADIAEEEPELEKSLRIVLAAPGGDLQMYPIGIDGEVVDLTLDNRDIVIRRKVNSLIPRNIQAHINSLVEGFSMIATPSVIEGLVSPKNIRDLIYGNPRIDVEDMISNLKLVGHKPSDMNMIWLFRYLRAMDQSKLKEFLRFLTGSSVAPLGSFSALAPSIELLYGATSSHLPRTRTCFLQLHLPRYLSEEQLAAKFDLALANNGEMEEQRF